MGFDSILPIVDQLEPAVTLTRSKSIPKSLKKQRKRRSTVVNKKLIQPPVTLATPPPCHTLENPLPSSPLALLLHFYTALLLPTFYKYHKLSWDLFDTHVLDPVSHSTNIPKRSLTSSRHLPQALQKFIRSRYKMYRLQAIRYSNKHLTLPHLRSAASSALGLVATSTKLSLRFVLNLLCLESDTLGLIGLIFGLVSFMAVVVVGLQMELEKTYR